MVATNIGQILNEINQKIVRTDLPEVHVGDTVKMKIKVQEGDKMRLHPFEGTVIRIIGGGAKGSFTVRKISFGEGVERTFPLHSPAIESMKIVNRGLVKRAKLYYLRERIGKKSSVEKMQVSQAQPAQAQEQSASTNA
jgi:large subunit ribosomal protein L19